MTNLLLILILMAMSHKQLSAFGEAIFGPMIDAFFGVREAPKTTVQPQTAASKPSEPVPSSSPTLPPKKTPPSTPSERINAMLKGLE